MIDIDKQIAFWRDSGKEDLAVAHELVNKNSIHHDLFFAHLALEKILKAHVCRVIQDIFPPRLHNLIRLAELASSAYNPPKLTFWPK
jgi:HEPN domain-containing protein